MTGSIRSKARIGLISVLSGLFLTVTALPPAVAGGGDNVEVIRQQLKLMSEQMETLQKKLEAIETKNEKEKADIKELDERVSKAELHTATDRVSFGMDLRTRWDSIHYSDIRVAPDSVINAFFTPVDQGGFNGATPEQIQGAIAMMKEFGMVPDAEKRDADNDSIFSTRFRLNMMSRFNPHLNFRGRLAANKVWGDSTGVKFNQGNLGDVTLDGNTSSLPHGDTLRLERAYFNYSDDIGRVPVNFSLGRRPSTEGPPLEYANYSLEGGSPLGTIINWQFDGASLNFGLEEMTDIPGAAFKLCYGVGFEGDWGNSYSLGAGQPDVDDVHLAGFIATMFDDDTTSAVLNYAHAFDITDGFTGLTVMPFTISPNPDGTINFAPNSGGFISRVEPSTEIGDWDAASLLLRTNLSERLADIDLFLATSWSHTDPSRVSENPFFGLMGQGLLSSNGDLKERDGYSIYAGALFPMPLDARLGIEYNWGSKYWLNFTGAEDSLVGSKLAVRGQVFESYYIQPIYRNNFFVKIGGRYYDYQYSGSGNPVGKPVKINDATALDTLNPVLDDVWDAYISVSMRY